ncbi:3-dehydroquinate synthase [Marinomonas mediterranea]|jgi:3-dehydroquinate synthase (EC 4.2.3.4)|uniref:3-dehydroquinate synthase n=1 Tax=Marinomonas mediterranea (strain ATCC 700492 / JCM 21426 / NBRC 103028 / MMB-1) TaxID=717774 RepID=F2JW40_MARM1|nr:3-dehydroquinate synthase [Marinomonas mediterranea]ADZ92928.1 3-dehydroquinate synthase [Marinomonas mediterranea MMB-1]WCN10850.1 3-dehydroquinate synthase [Marinomonas mediterranea]WCN14907.1 3-dehydroquinate synthase [Marinomonas mediterranea]WCN18951.1 3-dehydroquinate synthase [Marinomonas mediterranea MMB-1]
MRTLTVDLGDRSYPIYIGAGIRKQKSLFADAIKGKQVMIVTNETIAPLYLDDMVALLSSDYQVDTCILADGEKYKTLDTYGQIMTSLLEAKHNRTTTIIALGGGVIGDMAGYAAATYQRGVDFIQVPTTLLSQVDSSVGGKTGVNHPLGKNMIGAFYQPQAVVIDTDSLKTLPMKELSAGMAEVIKYGLICDKPFFEWLENEIEALMSLDAERITESIYKSCEAKAKVVALDEREGGIRAILNLGHTFGHAIETEMGYGAWLHGEAVAAGMVLAVDLSCRMGNVSSEELVRTVNLLKAANLPVLPPQNMTKDAFLSRMILDKKVLDGNLRLVLLESLGDAITTSDFPEDYFNACLEDALEASRLN